MQMFRSPRNWHAAIVSISLVLAAATSGIAMQKPPEPDKAIQSEFRMIEQQGTKDAYELFIQRHPSHPLSKIAKARIKAMTKN